MNKTIEFTITSQQDGLMIKAVLREYGLSRREVSRLKFTNGLLVNGNSVRVTEIVHAQDVVTLHFPEKDEAHALILTQDPEILYEDEDVVVVNKPAGLPCHPSHEHLTDDMGTVLQNYYGGKFTVRAVGRLDKDVSGIMVYAKNQPACARLSQQRGKDTLHKEYYAIVEGIFEKKAGTLRYKLLKVPGRKDRIVSEKGQACITEYTVVQEYKDISLVKVHLITGRTHQIRAGMTHFHHALLGDSLYGGKDTFYRPALHCGYVSFEQPFTHKKIEITLPLPEDMQALLQ